MRAVSVVFGRETKLVQSTQYNTYLDASCSLQPRKRMLENERERRAMVTSCKPTGLGCGKMGSSKSSSISGGIQSPDRV